MNAATTTTTPAAGPASLSPVDAALDYAAYAEGKGGTPDLWKSRYPRLSAGDKAISLPEWKTRPDRCLTILAAEVIRLRGLLHAEAAR